MPTADALTWQSVRDVANGYAMSTREILRALDGEGIRVAFQQVLEPSPRTNVAVTYAPPSYFADNRGRRRVGFTMQEVDGFPADWVRAANTLDEIWTPTEFNRAALVAGGVTRPVHIVPLGVDPEQFHPGAPAYRNPRGEYVFLTSLEWGDRKNPELLLQTFNRTFRREEPVLLVCKINHRDAGIHVPNTIRALGLDPRGGRAYFIYNRELPYEQLASLYCSADCFVSTSRGEGWGMPLLEAMACGLPAIATDWSGHTAFLDPADTYPLRVRALVPAPRTCAYYDGFRWAEPDEEHLASLLRHVYEHRDEARERGLRASARVRAQFTWGHTAKKIVARLSFGA
jgi:glycosyltransferase involved in cell wall biosynthesis